MNLKDKLMNFEGEENVEESREDLALNLFNGALRNVQGAVLSVIYHTISAQELAIILQK